MKSPQKLPFQIPSRPHDILPCALTSKDLLPEASCMFDEERRGAAIGCGLHGATPHYFAWLIVGNASRMLTSEVGLELCLHINRNRCISGNNCERVEVRFQVTGCWFGIGAVRD
jgi:hypothetical protein